MKEILFIVEESQAGGYFAGAVNQSIITQGETMEELRNMISDAVRCHFEQPVRVRLRVAPGLKTRPDLKRT